MLKILHKRPWFITNNNSYRFTDTNVWESTQKDFTFYVDAGTSLKFANYIYSSTCNNQLCV